MITKRIHEGKYIKLSRPVPESEMTCLRCGGTKGHAFKELDGSMSWFCMNEDCMKEDRDIGRNRSRQQKLNELYKTQNIEFSNPRSYEVNKGRYWYQKD